MKIAPGSCVRMGGLKLDDPNRPDWAKAVGILEARLHDRYIPPVDFPIASEDNKALSESAAVSPSERWTACCWKLSPHSLKVWKILKENPKKNLPHFPPNAKAIRGRLPTNDIANKFYKQFRKAREKSEVPR